ncbi:hypothetical protein ACFORJ_03740 [Corynebacterium hansenii]|uniref:Uncharacterized protein n=1 Tax=Corynebacterium hansenii TaxID=394964 RepID=A0ABV7ZM89_9CORY|nr:hypothetical protein [Corynebacterium hansenii]WJY98887.1 hypothetical protein CHAN_01260 [Corynebacterium hansenii]
MKWLTLATLVAAAGSFAILFLSAWGLATDVNIQFVAYWGLFFAMTGVLGGLMQETTRAVGSSLRPVGGTLDDAPAPAEVHRSAGGDGAVIRARPMTVAAGVAAVTFVLFAASGPLWVDFVVHDGHVLAVLLMAGGLAMYAMQAAVSGVLSGARLWGQYAALIILDIVVRVVPAALAWWLGWGLGAWLWITVIGTVSWLLLAAVSPATRRAMMLRADVPVRRFVPLMVTAMGAAGASAVLVTGFPTLVKISADHGAGALGAVTAAGIAYAVTLTRAPLLMPLEKFQNAIIVHFVRATGGPLAALAKPLGALFAFGLFGSALAWLIGPWILEVILQPDYSVPGRTLAGLTLGATFTAVLMVTGAVTLAIGRHRAYLLGWLVATVVATAILFGPGTLELRSVLALVVGPSLGVAIHLLVLKAVAPEGAAGMAAAAAAEGAGEGTVPPTAPPPAAQI